ncbi:hypothetical protein [Zavarzinella formosa]|uniref:hypothetical protein n=1 Tax=Zavarzinella formosa TaxID=360055 RepID=UPI0002F38125|nr:hypothetical protein [Zavarzinella formosa]
MDIDREVAEASVRDHLRQFGRFDGVDVTLDAHDVGEGWQVVVQPANSYLRRHRRELTLPLFVDRADGRVHHIPSFGLKGLVAWLRGTI